jgi:hypothetical protein
MAGGPCGDPIMHRTSTPILSNGTPSSCEIIILFLAHLELTRIIPEKAYLRRQPSYVHALLVIRHSLLPAWQVPNYGVERLARDRRPQPLGKPWQLGSFRPTYAPTIE